MDRITFSVNFNKCSVGSEVDADTTLLDYIRDELNLRGTKFMCREGGCGACVVAVTTVQRGVRRTYSVNSCLVNVTSCQDWDVTTIEGIGNRSKGYHPVQKTLAEYNGTQCGYCSPGWVMAMYSLLEANDYKLTQYEIENSFGSNTCRCTGYRPILEAFKSFAKDAPKPVTQHVADIEDLSSNSCRRKDSCKKDCGSWCYVSKSDVDVKKVIKINLKDQRVWYRVNEVNDIFDVLKDEGRDSYMLINGNTGRGATPILIYPRVLIDISNIEDLKTHYFDQNLVVGAGIPLTDLMILFKQTAKEYVEFSYLQKLYDHLDLVAHIPVRNIGTVAGNLMVKHRTPTFSSDVFLLLESVGAVLVIVGRNGTIEMTPEEFLYTDMTEKLIFQFKLPPLSKQHEFVSFKVMPRAQNAHAQVNAAFLYKFDHLELDIVVSARIVIGGLSGRFVHATKTEEYVRNKNIFTNDELQNALKVLEAELIVDDIAGEKKPEYRKKCALGLFYKALLVLIPKARLSPRYRSGARDFRKTRPLSKGTEVYDTNPIVWPLNEPMPKLDALIQCAGEAQYVNDVPTNAKQVFCSFVTSDIGTGEIIGIDPAPALKTPGVLAFFSAKDIPGNNSFTSQTILNQQRPEEIFADKTIKYYDQPIGVLVAETDRLAYQGARLVQVEYKMYEKKPLLTINEVRQKEPDRVQLFIVIPARNRGADVKKIIKGFENIFQQYHFPMETISCVSKPSETGLDIVTCSQYTNNVQIGVSEMLNIKANRIYVTVPRCGGAYGIKITRTGHVATACSLVSYLMNKPSRFVMSIQAMLRVVGKRLPCTSDFEVAVNSSGEIQYMEYHLYCDNGYVVNEPVSAIVLGATKNTYDNRRWQFKIFDVTTDTASNTFARSPGSLEAISMTEHIMERITYVIDGDPIEVRRNNLSAEYPETPEMLETLLKDSDYYERREKVNMFNKLNRWKKRGIRIAVMSCPVVVAVDYHVQLAVYHADASVIVTHGGVEMGQGINTKVIQTVAFTLNIPIDMVRCKPVDTANCPNNFTDGGSRATLAVTYGVVKCCQIILDRLDAIRDTLNNPTWQILIQTAFTRGINLQANYNVNSNDQQVFRSGGIAITEVELDILTGEHEVLRVDIIEDVGTSVNPELDIGQVEGAFVMGLGYWTHEELIFDEKTGELLTDRTWYYDVPLAKDVPIDFRVQLRRNSYNPIGTLGAKAVAEPPTCLAVSVAFALREAISSSREETGFPKNQWFNVDGPYTVATNVLKADVKLQEFLFH